VISGDSVPPPVNTAASPDQSVIRATIYRLQMPYGANSRDNSFWKLVDEDAVDPGTARSLSSNGFRIGRARISDWPEFYKVLNAESAINLSTASIISPPNFEDGTIPISDPAKVIPEELLFVFDNHGLTARSFDDCINMLAVAVEWTPRKTGSIRLRLCPDVKCTQTRMDYSLADNPQPVGIDRDEHIYDLHLMTDVAPGEFLVIGTSPATEDPNRVASVFLTRDGPTQRYEQVLIFVGDPGLMANMRFHRPHPTTHRS
jgi:hypothetical protein